MTLISNNHNHSTILKSDLLDSTEDTYDQMIQQESTNKSNINIIS